MTLVPSYGRDYRSAKAVKADFEAGKDFTIASVGRWMGSQVSIRDLKGQTVTLRYAKLTKCVVVKAGEYVEPISAPAQQPVIWENRSK